MAECSGYKDSGAAWIGKIPCTWDVHRLKVHLNRFEEKNPGDMQVLSLYRDLGIVPKDSRDDNHNVTSEDTSKYKYVQVGNFVVNKMKAWQGSVAVSDYEGIVSPAYYVYKFTDSDFHKRYFHYLLRSCYREEFMRLSGGIRIGQWDLSSGDLDNVPVLLPPMEEQKAIALYLDNTTKCIEDLISEAKASIEEYKSWKASIIYEAVTKGLDPNVEMKDSGVEWIGKMPVHWRLIPFRYVLQERNERNTSVISKERLSLSIDLGVTLYADKTTNLDRFKEDFSQYKLAYAGDLVMNSMNMIVGASGVSSWFGCVSPAYYTFYDTIEDHVTAKFCEYIFRNKAMLRVLHSLGKEIYSIERGDDRVNTCRLKVSKDDLKKILIPIPPIEEQRKIVRYLKTKCTMLDTLVDEKQALIADLESYKKSLIFEVVTGKRRVV